MIFTQSKAQGIVIVNYKSPSYVLPIDVTWFSVQNGDYLHINIISFFDISPWCTSTNELCKRCINMDNTTVIN